MPARKGWGRLESVPASSSLDEEAWNGCALRSLFFTAEAIYIA